MGLSARNGGKTDENLKHFFRDDLNFHAAGAQWGTKSCCAAPFLRHHGAVS
jgi:hypothetical protein